MDIEHRFLFASLPNREMWAAINDPETNNLAIYGCIDFHDREMRLAITNRRTPICVPFSAFEPSGTGLAPDFTQFSITDYGHTVKLGEYEAAVDCLIAEFGGGDAK